MAVGSVWLLLALAASACLAAAAPLPSAPTTSLSASLGQSPGETAASASEAGSGPGAAGVSASSAPSRVDEVLTLLSHREHPRQHAPTSAVSPPRLPFGRLPPAAPLSSAAARPAGFASAPSASTPKVFVVGLPRTGGARVGRWLGQLGLRCLHHDEDNNGLLTRSHEAAAYSLAGLYDDVDCVTGSPTSLQPAELAKAYPSAIFLVTERDTKAWIAAMERQTERRDLREQEERKNTCSSAPTGNPLMQRALMERLFSDAWAPRGTQLATGAASFAATVSSALAGRRVIRLPFSALKSNAAEASGREAILAEMASALGLKLEDASGALTTALATRPIPSPAAAPLCQEVALPPNELLKRGSRSRYAYVTIIGGASPSTKGANSFSAEYLLSAAVMCDSVRQTYTAAAGRHQSAHRSDTFDMVLLTLDDLSADQLSLVSQCFTRVLRVSEITSGIRGVPLEADTLFARSIRAQLYAWQLIEYTRVIYLEADQLVVQSLDSLFFRDWYEHRAVHHPLSGQRINARQVQEAPRELYAAPSTVTPLMNGFLSLAPSRRVFAELFAIVTRGTWTQQDGWMDYGRWTFAPGRGFPQAKINERALPATTSALPTLPDSHESFSMHTAWVSQDWNFSGAPRTKGVLLWYFFLVHPGLGGILDAKEVEGAVRHFYNARKPWLHGAPAEVAAMNSAMQLADVPPVAPTPVYRDLSPIHAAVHDLSIEWESRLQRILAAAPADVRAQVSQQRFDRQAFTQQMQHASRQEFAPLSIPSAPAAVASAAPSSVSFPSAYPRSRSMHALWSASYWGKGGCMVTRWPPGYTIGSCATQLAQDETCVLGQLDCYGPHSDEATRTIVCHQDPDFSYDPNGYPFLVLTGFAKLPMMTQRSPRGVCTSVMLYDRILNTPASQFGIGTCDSATMTTNFGRDYLLHGESCQVTVLPGLAVSPYSGSLTRTCRHGVLSPLPTLGPSCVVPAPPTNFYNPAVASGGCDTYLGHGQTCQWQSVTGGLPWIPRGYYDQPDPVSHPEVLLVTVECVLGQLILPTPIADQDCDGGALALSYTRGGVDGVSHVFWSAECQGIIPIGGFCTLRYVTTSYHTVAGQSLTRVCLKGDLGLLEQPIQPTVDFNSGTVCDMDNPSGNPGYPSDTSDPLRPGPVSVKPNCLNPLGSTPFNNGTTCDGYTVMPGWLQVGPESLGPLTCDDGGIPFQPAFRPSGCPIPLTLPVGVSLGDCASAPNGFQPENTSCTMVLTDGVNSPYMPASTLPLFNNLTFACGFAGFVKATPTVRLKPQHCALGSTFRGLAPSAACRSDGLILNGGSCTLENASPVDWEIIGNATITCTNGVLSDLPRVLAKTGCPWPYGGPPGLTSDHPAGSDCELAVAPFNSTCTYVLTSDPSWTLIRGSLSVKCVGGGATSAEYGSFQDVPTVIQSTGSTPCPFYPPLLDRGWYEYNNTYQSATDCTSQSVNSGSLCNGFSAASPYHSSYGAQLSAVCQDGLMKDPVDATLTNQYQLEFFADCTLQVPSVCNASTCANSVGPAGAGAYTLMHDFQCDLQCPAAFSNTHIHCTKGFLGACLVVAECPLPAMPYGLDRGNCPASVADGGQCTLTPGVGFYQLASGSLDLTCDLGSFDLPVVEYTCGVIATPPIGFLVNGPNVPCLATQEVTSLHPCFMEDQADPASGYGYLEDQPLANQNPDPNRGRVTCVDGEFIFPALVQINCGLPSVALTGYVAGCTNILVGGAGCTYQIDSALWATADSLTIKCNQTAQFVFEFTPMPAIYSRSDTRWTAKVSDAQGVVNRNLTNSSAPSLWQWNLPTTAINLTVSIDIHVVPIASFTPAAKPASLKLAAGVNLYSFTVRANDGTTAPVVLNFTVAQPPAPASTPSTPEIVTSVVGVIVPATVVTVASVNEDPCRTQNPCLNGGVCSAVITRNGTTADGTLQATLSCQCMMGFFTPTCASGLLECASCVVAYVGGSQVVLRGVGFANLRALSIGGQLVTDFNWTDANGAMTTRSLLATTAIETITFLSPLIPSKDNSTGVRASTYQPMTLAFTTNETALAGYSLPGLVYATASTCTHEGEFKQLASGGCSACPTGATCPGGGRAWPLKDYWSVSEYQPPLACPILGTCAGTTKMASAVPTTDGSNQQSKLTQNCEEGYDDVQCIRCSSNYYQLSGRCYQCPSDRAQKAQITLVIFAAGIATFCLSLAVAFLDGRRLSTFVMGFVLLQRVSAIGVTASRDLPNNARAVSEFFQYLQAINYNVEIVNPGCAVNALTFIGYFWSTVAFIGLTYLSFLAAAFLRYKVDQQRFRRDPSARDVTPEESFRRRRMHTTIIAFALFYLRTVTLQVQAFRCAMGPDQSLRGQVVSESTTVDENSYLIADRVTRCYIGTHAGTLTFVVITLIFYTFGFPFMITLTLRRAFNAKVDVERPTIEQEEGVEMATAKSPGPALEDDLALKVSKSTDSEDGLQTALQRLRLDSYGVMFSGLRPEVYLYKITQFPVSVWYAFVTTFLTAADQIPLALFLLGLSTFFQSVLAIWTQPFVIRRSNLFVVLTTVGTLAYTTILLLVQERANSAPTYGYVLVGLFAVCILLLVFRPQLRSMVGTATAPMVLKFVDGRLQEVAASPKSVGSAPSKAESQRAFTQMRSSSVASVAEVDTAVPPTQLASPSMAVCMHLPETNDHVGQENENKPELVDEPRADEGDATVESVEDL